MAASSISISIATSSSTSRAKRADGSREHLVVGDANDDRPTRHSESSAPEIGLPPPATPSARDRGVGSEGF